MLSPWAWASIAAVATVLLGVAVHVVVHRRARFAFNRPPDAGASEPFPSPADQTAWVVLISIVALVWLVGAVLPQRR